MSHRDLPDNPAERALFNRLVVLGNPPSEVFKLIDDYAHELAEQLRSHPEARKYGRGKWAADLIDPSTGSVRPDEEPT